MVLPCNWCRKLINLNEDAFVAMPTDKPEFFWLACMDCSIPPQNLINTTKPVDEATDKYWRWLNEKKTNETINHPQHYGGDTPHEVIKCLSAWGLESDALLWNVVKYIARAGKKTSSPLEDLKKAEFYLQHKIAKLEEKVK